MSYFIGIIRYDMIAESIIATTQNSNDIPLVVRRQGKNATEEQKLVIWPPYPTKSKHESLTFSDCEQ